MQSHPENGQGVPKSKKNRRNRFRPSAFLSRVWRDQPAGYRIISTRDPDRLKGEGWRDHAFENPSRREIERFLQRFPADSFDLYFCPNVFSKARRLERYVLKTIYAWSDIDGADPELFVPPPGCLWETSPGRFQGLWRFGKLIEPSHAAAISRQLAYAHDADKGGWDLTQALRLPGTVDHKPDYDLPKVRLIREDWTPTDPPAVKSEPKRRRLKNAQLEADFSDRHEMSPREVREVWWQYRKHLSSTAKLCMCKHSGSAPGDRSRAISAIVAGLYRGGADIELIKSVLWVNVYFRSKHGASLKRLDDEVRRIIDMVERDDE